MNVEYYTGQLTQFPQPVSVAEGKMRQNDHSRLN